MVSPGPCGCHGPVGSALSAGDDGARDDLGHPDGLGGRARCAAGRPVARRFAGRQRLSPRAFRSPGRAGAAANGAVLERIDRVRARVRAGVRLRARTRHLAPRGGLVRTGGGRTGGRGAADPADDGPEPGARGSARDWPGGGCRPATRCSARSRGRTALLRRRSPRPTVGCLGPGASGTSGSHAAASPIIPGAHTCNGPP